MFATDSFSPGRAWLGSRTRRKQCGVSQEKASLSSIIRCCGVVVWIRWKHDHEPSSFLHSTITIVFRYMGGGASISYEEVKLKALAYVTLVESSSGVDGMSDQIFGYEGERAPYNSQGTENGEICSKGRRPQDVLPFIGTTPIRTGGATTRKNGP